MDTIAPKPWSLRAIFDYFVIFLLAVILGPIALFILGCMRIYERVTGRAVINDEPINTEPERDQTPP